MIENGIILTDASGAVRVCNQVARQLLGIKESGAVTKPELEEVLKKLGLGKPYEEVSVMNIESVVKEITVPGQAEINLRCSLSAMKNDAGAYEGAAIIIRNITKEYEVEKAKSDFLAAISHELRTPLTAMTEFISIILDGIPGKLNPKQREYLTVISDNIDRMTRIVSRILDMANIQQKKSELKREMVNISDLIGNVTTFFASKADAKHILLTNNVTAATLNLYIDRDAVIQVMVNLIDNAIKYSEFWGKITVNLAEKENEVLVSVSDTGKGIAPDHHKMIFDKFRQVDQTFGPGEKGVGLGLSICKDFIEMHKGKIWVESVEGKGSTFLFTLPKFSEEVLIKEYLVDAVSAAQVAHKQLSLLVLDIENYWDLETKYGDAEASRILKDFGSSLKSVLRGNDKVAIYKRKKAVAIILEGDKQSASMVEKRLKEIIEKGSFDWKQKEIKPNISYMLATYPDDAASAKELLEKTGAALT